MMRFPTKPIKVSIKFKDLIENANLQRVRVGKDRKIMSIPKALDKISKHKLFPKIMDDYVIEEFK